MEKIRRIRFLYYFLKRYIELFEPKMKDKDYITAKDVSRFFEKNVTQCLIICNELAEQGYLIKKGLKNSNRNGYWLNIEKISQEIKDTYTYLSDERIEYALKNSEDIQNLIFSNVKTAKKVDFQYFLKEFGSYELRVRREKEIEDSKQERKELKQEIKEIKKRLDKIEIKKHKN